MSNVSRSQRKFLECTSRFRIHGHGRRLGAENQDPNFGPGNRSLYLRIEDKRPIFKFSPRGLCEEPSTDGGHGGGGGGAVHQLGHFKQFLAIILHEFSSQINESFASCPIPIAHNPAML